MDSNTKHLPLLSGVQIGASGIDGTIRQRIQHSIGTLTGLATLNSDRRKKVLVTNQHVAAGEGPGTYTGRYRLPPEGTQIHQPALPEDETTPVAADVVGANIRAIDPDADNFLDAAALDLYEVNTPAGTKTADYLIHDPTHGAAGGGHRERKIRFGVVEPWVASPGEPGVQNLLLVGTRVGETTATTSLLNQTKTILAKEFNNIVELRTTSLIRRGDSGPGMPASRPSLIRTIDLTEHLHIY